MPKKVNLLPNERVDIVDLQQAAQDYAQQLSKQWANRGVLDKFSRVGDGFRVEIANQTTNPGTFTVHNGVAYDRAGQVINNEDDLNTARSATLTINGTYFLEVQFVEAASDVDARAFWDPSFDNGADPSGDSRLPGREFSQNVATRKSPDWQIVTPISTTGFDLASNPNSTKIPVAVIVRSGGTITGATTVSARSCLAASISSGATSIKVFDSRLMPSTFTGTVGAESVSVTANDKENGILTLGSGTSTGHIAGERVVVAGATPAQFLTERTTPLSTTTPLPAAGPTSDSRPRLWQGDEERGSALWQNANAASGNSDNQVKALRDYVDYLAGQIRDIRWGSPTSTDLGTKAPPVAFSFQPRYYETAGGLQGARTNTVSVGDGVTSFGDFNVNHYTAAGSDTQAKLAIQAAHDALPAAGGTIYLKGKSAVTYYTIGNNPIIFTKNVRLIGDGYAITQLRADGTASLTNPCVQINSGIVIIQGVSFVNGGNGTDSAFLIQSGQSFVMRDCRCDGFNANTTGVGPGSYFENCIFNGSTSVGLMAWSGIASNTVFKNCSFSQPATLTTAYAVFFETCNDVSFEQCQFSLNAAQQNVYCLWGSNANNLKLTDCQFTGGGIGCFGAEVDSNLTADCSVHLLRCRSDMQGGILTATSVSCASVIDCSVDILAGGNKGVQLTSCIRCIVRGTKFTQTSFGSGTQSIGVALEAAADCIVDGCHFIDSDVAVGLACVSGIACDGNQILNSKHLCTTVTGRGRTGIDMTLVISGSPIQHAGNAIRGCAFVGLSATANAQVQGIKLSNAVRTWIVGNEFIGIGTATYAGNAYGIRGDTTLGAFQAICTDNEFRDIQCLNNSVAGIWLTSTSQNYGEWHISNNNFAVIGSAAVNAGAHGIVCGKYNQLSVTNNCFVSIGITSATNNCNIIDIGFQATSYGDGRNAVITGNQFQDVHGAGVSGFNQCINVFGAGDKLVVSNNIMEINDTNVNGISINGVNPDIAGAKVGNIQVSGNVIEGSNGGSAGPYGIIILQYLNDQSQTRVSVTNNIVRNCHVEGIHMEGGGVNAWPYLVANNIVEYDVNSTSVSGIVLLNMDVVSVTGNVISFQIGGGFNQCIYLSNVRRCAITGNTYFNAAGGFGIYLDTVLSGVVVGNMAIRGGAPAITAFSAGTRILCYANMEAPTSSLSMLGFSGAIVKTTAASAVSDNIGTVPGSLSDVYLNITSTV